jgi:ligand-binding sensor domain-containing protein
MAYDSIHNRIWVSHRKGIVGIKAGKEPEVWKQMALPLEQPPTSIAELPNGKVLMHITRRSSWLYHPQTDNTALLDQFRWFTNTRYTSKGEVWLCGWGSGIHQLDVSMLQPVKSNFPEIGNYGIVVGELVEAPALTSDSLLWVIGTHTGKMLCHKQKNTIIHRFAYQPQLKSGNATELHNTAYYAPDGPLWVCSWMGLEKIKNYTHRFQQGELPALHTIEYNMLSGIKRHHSRPQMLWVSIHGSGIALMKGTGWLWMTCWRGLVGYHNLTGQKRIYPVSSLPSHNAEYPVLEGLAADTAGFKYIGGQFGLLRFKEGMHDMQRLAYRKNPDIERIIGLAISGSTLLIGAQSGLYAYDLLHQECCLIHPNILPVHAHGIKTDSHGNIWIYTQSALVKYEPGSGEFDFFNTVDGLYAVHKHWATLFEFEGKMHLGHRMAYTRWDPEQAGRNTNVPLA